MGKVPTEVGSVVGRDFEPKVVVPPLKWTDASKGNIHTERVSLPVRVEIHPQGFERHRTFTYSTFVGTGTHSHRSSKVWRVE